ncbi:MAG: NAD(P)-dependent oxidoreductase, partial [Patescibacteria group bacterium]|nr:NAD(P)-dependent oxidoreductase [Patescibacteria group bacterium]
MKVVITGGAGFVGKNLIRVMLNSGFSPSDLFVIDKNKTNLNFVKNLGVKTILADLADQGEWSKGFHGQDLVISLHAQISGPNYEDFKRNNIDATQNVIEAAKSAGIDKIVHFSSAAVLSIRQDFYATSKKAGEELVKNSGLKYVAIQPSLMYGPLDNKNIGWLIKFARSCPVFPIPGNGRYPRQPIYIDDMAHLVIGFIKNFPIENKVYSIN